jgi:hypothetical protein
MREIKISLETATRWFNGTDNELKALAIQTYPELGKKQLPKSWEELKLINGYYFNVDSELNPASKYSIVRGNYNIFATENQAKSSLAMAKLSQVMAVYNDGWVADWSDCNQVKYCILFHDEQLEITETLKRKQFIVLKTKQLAEEFLENFREDIETYFNF